MLWSIIMRVKASWVSTQVTWFSSISDSAKFLDRPENPRQGDAAIAGPRRASFWRECTSSERSRLLPFLVIQLNFRTIFEDFPFDISLKRLHRGCQRQHLLRKDLFPEKCFTVMQREQLAMKLKFIQMMICNGCQAIL
ncbi:MAG: hypothetical protein CW342_04980 [Thermoactinomycetaceae bacterium]|nr:hypothetical protein [Bacillota bacterium]MBO2532232.1 hypothetical protein [Thermoactinomycetaceae bacterium]